jgi:hypothetical protein
MAHHSVADLGGVVIDWNPRYLYRKLFMVTKQRWNTSALPFTHRRGTHSKTPGGRLPMVAIPLSEFIPVRPS